MPVPHAIRVVVGAILAALVVAWVWAVVNPPAADEPLGPAVSPGPQLTSGRSSRVPPLPPPEGLTLAVLPILQPGMSRVEVEDVLGVPNLAQVQPVGGSGGRVTYHAAYPITLAGGGGAPRPPAGGGPLCFVAFEFDATLPGHPLINVLYPDPLF